MILEVTSDSTAMARITARTLWALHIAAGGIGIASGAAALISQKGRGLHRVVGTVFFVSMLIMSAIGAVASPFLPKPQWANVFIGALTFYLVSTSWMTIRRKEGCVGAFEFGALIVALCIALAALVAGTLAMRMPHGSIDGLSYGIAYGFAAIWMLIAVADLKIILRGGVYGTQRIVRHLWRMGVPLLIAVVSLFIGQSKVFPEFVRASGVLFLPVFAGVGALLFWLVRARH